MSGSTSAEEIRAAVRQHYGQAAKTVLNQQSTASCCGPSASDASCCGGTTVSPIVIGNYRPGETDGLPEAAVLASLGCGNPTALAQLQPGQTVLDLGSGGGIDVLLSARRVGPTGCVYGLDMTDEMLELAERNRQDAGVENVTFLKGTIEAIPLPDNSVDVIISNCVINLAADKSAVFHEAFRVLRPGGQFAVSDIVTQGELDTATRADMDSWAACIAGALEEQEYLTSLTAAGFANATIEITHVHNNLTGDASCCGSSSTGSGKIVSGFIRATKPT